VTEDITPPWGQIAGICLATLLVYTGFGVIQPIFPVWAAAFSDSMTEVGVATTLSAGIGLIAARPLAAWLMEGRRRSPTLVAGAVVSAGMAALLPELETLYGVFLARAGQGLGFGLVATAALASVLDLAPPARRGQVMGYFGASTAVALLIGPLIGGAVVARWDMAAAFWVTGGFCLAGTGAVFFLRESAVGGARQGFSFAAVMEIPGLGRLICVHFMGILIHGVLLTFLPLRLEGHDGFVQADVFFAIEAGAVVVLRLGLGRRFDGFDRRLFLVLGLLALTGAGLGLGFAESDLGLGLAAVAYGVGFGLYLPMIYATAGDITPLATRVRGLAVVLLAFDLAVAGGGVVMGPVADAFDAATALACAAAFPAAALAIVAFGGPFVRTPEAH